MHDHERPKDICLVHGWGMNSAVWGDFETALSGHSRVTCIDLPGHGERPYPGEKGLDEWVSTCIEQAPDGAVWIGWSLGAMVAIRAVALHPEQISGLICLAGTPRFVKADDWPDAVEPQVLDGFISASRLDHQKTLERFLALQLRGSESMQATLRELKARLSGKPQPNPEALDEGLSLLRTVDLREGLKSVSTPMGWLLGERDTLVPVGMSRHLTKYRQKDPLEVIPKAAHAPFLSHPQATLEAVLKLMDAFDDN